MTCWGGGHSRGGVPNPDEVLEGLPREVISRVVVFVGFFVFLFFLKEEVARSGRGILSQGAAV